MNRNNPHLKFHIGQNMIFGGQYLLDCDEKERMSMTRKLSHCSSSTSTFPLAKTSY